MFKPDRLRTAGSIAYEVGDLVKVTIHGADNGMWKKFKDTGIIFRIRPHNNFHSEAQRITMLNQHGNVISWVYFPEYDFIEVLARYEDAIG